MTPNELTQALTNARESLLQCRGDHGHWEGELSSSALSTATTVCALRDYLREAPSPLISRKDLQRLIDRGRQWLADHQNDDGGWGDTIHSFSNISTTALCWGALAGQDGGHGETVARCEDWLRKQAGGIDPDTLSVAIRRRYGKDHTFSVPILTALALSGRLGTPPRWDLIPQLPFELAAFPHQLFAALRMPVVSYALPALIAIGQLRHFHRPSQNPLLRWGRNAVRSRTSQLLRSIQPTSGGYLEASPLTSFVTMSLIGAGRVRDPVVTEGIRFLIESVRPDGSWAIDSNLATWVTTLSVRALAASPGASPQLNEDEKQSIRKWLLNQQYRVEHPYTHAAPGGWAWTDLPGGVPDADDTPGALCALKTLVDPSDGHDAELIQAAAMGVEWLLNLQNRDGGIPTFCRGWGTLPFDRSSADLTAHTLRAWRAWEDLLPDQQKRRLPSARARAIGFLIRQQRADGAWLPLWFGNQHVFDDENPVYGTTRVLLGLIDELPAGENKPSEAIARAQAWLLNVQNEDGGWGGGAEAPSLIEETAFALEALTALLQAGRQGRLTSSTEGATEKNLIDAIQRGGRFLIESTNNGTSFPASPIGFYFAKLWYFESLYPMIFTVSALGHVLRVLGHSSVPTASELVP